MAGEVIDINIQSGKRLDLRNDIFDLMGEKTPLFTMVKKAGASDGFETQYQVDMNGTVPKTGRYDNQAYTDADYTNQSADRETLTTCLHKIGTRVGIGDTTSRVTTVAGVGKGAKILARDIAKGLIAASISADQILCDNNEQKKEAANVGSETRGLFKWFDTIANQTVYPVSAKYGTPAAQRFSGKVADFGESVLKNIANSIFTHVGYNKKMIALCGIQLKSRISAFADYVGNSASEVCLRRNFKGQTDGTISATVDIYKCDGATFELIPSNNLNRGVRTGAPNTAPNDVSNWSGLILDMDNHDVYVDQYPQYEDLPNNGGGRNGRIQMIIKNRVGNPLVGGRIVPDLT